MLTPYYQDDSVTLYHGDSLTVLPELERGAAAAILTDPPYSSGGMVRGDRMQSTRTKYVQSSTLDVASSFTGDNRDQRAFLLWYHLWVSEALKVLAPGGIVGTFTDWRQLPTTTDALQVAGVVWRGILPWAKPNGRHTQGRYANNCEYMVWGTNGPRALEGVGGTLSGYWLESAPREREHQTQKPLALMEWLTLVVNPGDTVLDPFAGSGTTLVAAKRKGRRAIGVELAEEFCEVTARRLEATSLGHTPADQASFDFGTGEAS